MQNGKLGSAAASVLSIPTTDVGGGMVAHTAFAFDVDGDGAPELVLAFAPAETAVRRRLGRRRVVRDGRDRHADELHRPRRHRRGRRTRRRAADVRRCGRRRVRGRGSRRRAAAPALLVLCRDPTGTSLLARVSGTTATLVATGLPPLRQIVAGDVTGDGIADIVAIRGDSGDRAYTVLVQCSSRDLACQAGAVTQ